MTTDTIIALSIIGLFFVAIILLTVILARRAPQAEHMAKPWVGNVVTGFVLMVLMTGIFVLLAIKDRAPWWSALFIVAFNLLCVCMIVPYFTRRMWVTDTCLIRQNFWGRKQMLYYRDVVKVVEQEYEVIFWFRSTPKWVIYAHDPKAEDPMLEAILEKIPKGQLDPDYPEPPVRLFANAVRGGAGEYYILWSIFYLLTLPILLMGIIGQSWIMTLIVLGVMAIWTVYMVLAVCSAKRAHASEKWANVAKFCWKKGVLRP
jgi:hypothetical protein